MKIEEQFGLIKSSLIEYPGHLCACIFTTGCNLRCPYCHNPELARGKTPNDFVEWPEIVKHLKRRSGVLEGVSISGGEPTLYPHIEELVEEIRALGYLIKIDTNGTRPDVLRRLEPDFVALDVKTSRPKYRFLVGRTDDLSGDPGSTETKREQAERLGEAVDCTIDWLVTESIEHEIRTTVVPGLVTIDDIEEISRRIEGCTTYILNEFNPGITLDPAYSRLLPYPSEVIEQMRKTTKTALTRDAIVHLRGRAGRGPTGAGQ